MSKFDKIAMLASYLQPAEYTKQANAEVEAPEVIEKSAADDKTLAVKLLQCLPANLKIIHVMTKSYAKHMALDEAFDDLNDSLDAFYECVQGHYVLKTGSRIPLSSKRFEFEEPADNEVLDAVKTMHEAFLAAAKSVTDGDSALESVRDNVSNAFQQLAYRLTLK